jgi:hypothetical protein
MAVAVDGTANTITASASSLTGSALSTATNGYYKVATSGVIIQWGISGSITANTAFTITFPLAFPTGCLFATNIPVTANLVGQMAPIVSATTATTFTGYNSTGIANTFRWMAIGY